MLLQAAHNYQERGMETFLLTASIADQWGKGRIASRIGFGADAHLYDKETDLHALIASAHNALPLACVLVDEAQFLTAPQVWQLSGVSDDLDIPVMCYGLRTDFKGQLFEGSATLLAIADHVREVRTICHCGRKATMVIKQAEDGTVLVSGEQIDIGGDDKYISLCRLHWKQRTGYTHESSG